MLSFRAARCFVFSAEPITLLSSERLGRFILAPLPNSFLSSDRRMADCGHLFTDFAAWTAGVVENLGIGIGFGLASRLGRGLLVGG